MENKNTFEKELESFLEKENVDANQFKHFFKESFTKHAEPHFFEYNKLMAYYRCAIMEIETKLNVLNEEFSLQFDRNPINGIKSRLKSLKSIREKTERLNVPFDISSIEENLNDIAGVRVICSFPDDVYMIANALLQQDDITLVCKKDYIKTLSPTAIEVCTLLLLSPYILQKKKGS